MRKRCRDKSPTHMFTSVDIMHDSALVLLAGTAKKNDAQAPPPVIASYSLAGGAFTEASRCPLAGPKLHALSCIPGTHKLVTGARPSVLLHLFMLQQLRESTVSSLKRSAGSREACVCRSAAHAPARM